jgi:hypothetical protein
MEKEVKLIFVQEPTYNLVRMQLPKLEVKITRIDG